jgi:hypothetical protein
MITFFEDFVKWLNLMAQKFPPKDISKTGITEECLYTMTI